MLRQGYQCGICARAIEAPEEETSLVLTAQNLRDWSKGQRDPRNQAFWVHFECLTEIWPASSYPWEASALVEPAD